MKITGEFIKDALKEYDSKTNYSSNSWLKSLFVYEQQDVAMIRDFLKQLTNNEGEITTEEGFKLVSILIKSKPMGAGYDEHMIFFERLNHAYGIGIFNAMKVLDKYGKFNQENYYRVVNHQNPHAAAKAINQLEKYPEILEAKDIQFELDDPYTQVKRQTSTHIACKILKEAGLDTDENRTLIAKDPVGFAHVLKQFSERSVSVTQEYISVIGEHQNPKNMGLAILEIDNLIKARQFEYWGHWRVFFREAIHHSKPLELIEAYKVLSKIDFGFALLQETFRDQVKQSNLPYETAAIIILDHTLKSYDDSNAAMKLLMSFSWWVQGSSVEQLHKSKEIFEEQIRANY